MVPLGLAAPNLALSDSRIVGTQERWAWSSEPRVSGSAKAGHALGSLALCKEELAAKERQELLWQHFFLHPWQWWDNRADKWSGRHPDFRHKISKEPLWLDNCYKPGWVDWQLARWDATAAYPYPWESMRESLSRSCGDGKLMDAVQALDLLVQRACPISCDLFYRVLKMCIEQKDLALGRRVHALAQKSGYESNAFLANHIIGMYSSHGKLEDAAEVFTTVTAPNAHMWATIMFGYVRHGEPVSAIRLYQRMRDSSLKPDNRVFVAVLKACAAAADLIAGEEVHADIVANDSRVDIFVGSSLVNMYAKCGSVEAARAVFDGLARRDVVTWNAMMVGYVQQGLGREALALYGTMQQEGFTPEDHVTFGCLLQACASMGALQQGTQLHAQIRKRGMEADLSIGSGLVDMYAKCGRLKDARKVFDGLPLSAKTVVTWSVLLNGYAEHGDGEMALQCFEEMRKQGVEPDGGSFVSLLVACSHAGLVQEGRRYFRMMVEEYGIVALDYHHNCMIDLLGRAGCLDEAEDILQTVAFDSYVVGLKALLSACRSHGDVERGKRCFERLVALDPQNAPAYVLLGGLYASAGRWEDVEEIERLRKSAGAWKKPAKACIELRQQVHEFTVGEERSEIWSKLRSVSTRLKEEGGHLPQTDLVLRPVSEQAKEDALCGHAEKLALAYGLLNTPDGTPLLVTKNLRMCDDCHSSTKIMSRLEQREIIVRDVHRVHTFMDGNCSCGDRH